MFNLSVLLEDSARKFEFEVVPGTTHLHGVTGGDLSGNGPANGYEIADRGRIPADVEQAYRDAT